MTKNRKFLTKEIVLFKGEVRRYCLQREAVQARVISQPVKSLM